jgi:hypothetical protein
VTIQGDIAVKVELENLIKWWDRCLNQRPISNEAKLIELRRKIEETITAADRGWL